MTWRGAVTIACFQIAWLACALGAGHGSAVPGLLAGLTATALHVALDRERRASWLVPLAAAFIGAVCESIVVGLGWISYSVSTPAIGLAPVWIVALWLAFGTTIAVVRGLISPNALIKSALIGALITPWSYVLGQRMGALVLADPLWPGLLALAIMWGAALPLLIALDTCFRDSHASETRSKSAGN